MDANTIEQILLEWGVNSNDGLVGGLCTNENILALKETLNGYGVDDLDEVVEQIINFEAQNRLSPEDKEKRKMDRQAARAAEKQAKQDAFDASEKERIGKIDSNVPTLESLTELKGLGDHAEEILKIVEYIPEFKMKFNQLSLTEAVDYVNQHGPEVQLILEEFGKLEASVKAKGKGEYIFVFLIKNCKSGGSSSGDLIIGDVSVDVKQMGEKNTFRTETTSIQGFSRSNFAQAVNELIRFCSDDPENVEVIKKLANRTDLTPELTTIQKNGIVSFVDTMDTEKFGVGTVNGLVNIGHRLRGLDASKDPNYADFFIDNEKKTVSVNNPEEVKPALSRDTANTQITVNVSNVQDKENEMILPAIKKLLFFKMGLDVTSIAEEMITKMKYNGGLILISHDLREFTYWTKEQLIPACIFYTWGKTLTFKLNKKPTT